MIEKPATEQTLPHLPFLDGIRGAGTLFVLGRHSLVFLDLKPKTPLESSLFSAVLLLTSGAMDVFFVLSAFLVTTILLKTLRAPRYFLNFYARRILRIVPPYYLLLALLILVIPAFFPARAADLLTLHRPFPVFGYLVNGLILQLNAPLNALENHLWTLSMEEQIYITWPLLVCFVPRRAIYWLTLVSLPLCLFLRHTFYEMHYNTMVIRSFTPLRLDSFLMGTSLAFLRADGLRDSARLARHALLYRAALWGGAAWGVGGIAFGHPAKFESHFANSATGLLTFGTIGLIASGRGLRRFQKPLEIPWLQKIGRCSYSTYLFHQPVFVLLGPVAAGWVLPHTHSVLITWLILTPLFMLLGLALGAAGYSSFEIHFLNLKRFFPYRSLG